MLGSTLQSLIVQYESEWPGAGENGKAGLARIAEEGAFEDSQTGTIGVPLYLANVLGGALLLHTKASEGERLSAHLETLTAIASLASIGFEANREVENLKVEKALLEERIGVPGGIVGNSAPIRRLLSLIERVAPRDSTVLITGESGTGKELIARALHQGSERRDHHFIAVNCAAMSENLFESELFGHEKGAFTGAIALKKGRFELAEGGTIFLDEVGELALPLQAKLLRVLQQREFERVGGTQVHSLNIRVIAATNRDLQEDIREGKFREDLALSTERSDARVAAFTGTQGRHSCPGTLLSRKVGAALQTSGGRDFERSRRNPDAVFVAGQCARARKRDGTCSGARRLGHGVA